MFGNNSSKQRLVFWGLLAFLLASPSLLFSIGRKIPVEFFNIGLDVEPGLKFVGGTGMNGDVGILLKFNDQLSIIPHIGMYPYTTSTNVTSYDYSTFPPTPSISTIDSRSTALNAGLTIRFEFPKVIVTKSTKFEYDVDKQEFHHYYYHSSFRPYIEGQIGNYIGAGGGFIYYLFPTTAIGFGGGLGTNLSADQNKFGFILPKLIVISSF
jgi:hypothetical protein